ERLHQGALAGAVLAHQGMDLAGEEVERHAVVRDERPEATGDVAEGDEGFGGVRARRMRFARAARRRAHEARETNRGPGDRRPSAIGLQERFDSMIATMRL